MSTNPTSWVHIPNDPKATRQPVLWITPQPRDRLAGKTNLARICVCQANTRALFHFTRASSSVRMIPR